MTIRGTRLHVAAAVLVNARGDVLVSRRHEDSHQGGLWEFPGGKLEDGEPVRLGLARELREELGIEVQESRPLIQVPHDYADRSVLLDVWRVERWEGEPHGREGQRIEWVPVEGLGERAFPAADAPIISAIRLPDTYLVTPEPGIDLHGFLDGIDRCLRAGTRLVQLRARRLGEEAYRDLAGDALALCRERGARLLLNAEPRVVDGVGAAGVHLTSRRLMALRARPLDAPYWVGASCHDAEELAHAGSIGADFAVLAPVHPTTTHPDASPLGWDGFEKLVREATIPVYALGGMKRADLSCAWNHGAQGIAAIRGLWG